MSETQQLILEIDAFLLRTGMAASTFGQRAIRNWKIVPHLKSGGSTSLKTAERLRTYMEQHRARGAESSEEAA